MNKIFLKTNYQNFLAKILPYFVALIFFSLISSCTDQGCIDADDFGEYESQTIEVLANAGSESCTYDSTLDITDSSQGSGIKLCLVYGSATVVDETNTTYTSSSDGCSGFSDAAIKQLCINGCIQSCLSNAGGSNGSAEPNWISTDKKSNGTNSGVTLSPASQIIVRATGTIMLSDSMTYPSAYVQASEYLPHSRSADWSDFFFDVSSSQTINLKFSGKAYYDPSSQSATTIGNGTSSSVGSTTYNGARRLVAYLIEHPTGYHFDTTKTTEKLGSIDVPLLPDPVAWTCDYTGSTTTESSCYSVTNEAAGYEGKGYPNVNNTLAATVFPITSLSSKDDKKTDIYSQASSITTDLGTYGGMVRWDSDGLESDSSFDPFSDASVSCNSLGVCANIADVSSTEGAIIGSASVATTCSVSSSSGLTCSSSNSVGNSSDAYKVSFKSLLSSATTCDISLAFQIIDGSSKVIYDFSTSGSNQISISNSSWSTDHITLEGDQKLVISAISTSTSSGVNCGKVIAMKINKYHDITIEKSGFVSFTMLNGDGSSSCTLKARVVNPSGSFVDFTNSGDTSDTGDYDADFYEYDDFPAYGVTYHNSATDTDSDDPLYNLSVPASSSSVQSWSSKVFLRKGQVIRFAPESWNGTWTTSNSLTRQCGIGMAMYISPRPALLCRGQASDIVANTDSGCTADYNSSGTLIGCKAYSSDCYDSTSSSYCPLSACQYPITCNPGEADYYQKSCTLSTSSTNGTCSYATGYTSTTCISCAAAMMANAQLAAKVDEASLDQCYDFESYTGKISNIGVGVLTSTTNVEAADSSVAKGAIKLRNFNGDYGNLEGFSSAGTTDSATGNAIFSVTSSITFSKEGRLRFFMLDADDTSSDNADADFRSLANAYNDNSSADSSYSGNNGFKIDFSGALEFSNGEWLQVKLCKETSGSSTVCKSTDEVTLDYTTDSTTNDLTSYNGVKLSAEPAVIDISSTSSTTSTPSITSGYKFDSYGNLTRTTEAASIINGGTFVSGDCALDYQGLATEVGSVFYCHTYDYYSSKDLSNLSSSEQDKVNEDISKLRLTFKILDPETATCNTSDPSSYDSTGASYDGIKLSNSYYDSTTSSNTGAMCDTDEYPVSSDNVPTGGTQCTKEFYCANKYYNNSGKYYVNVKVKKTDSGAISNIIGGVITPVIEVMDGKSDGSTVGQAERIYKLLIADSRYQAILTMCLVVMYTFYGFGYLLGVAELTSSELINRVVKIGLIYFFVGDEGWDWFQTIVVTFFKDGTDYLAFMMASSFDSSAELQNAIANSDYYDKSVLFSSVDKVFSMFFSSAVQKKVSALLFASIFGWAYLLIIYNAFMLYVYAVANAVLLYLTAQVFISILFTLGPIFFVFTLFGQTKEMFDKWLSQLIGFSLQQIFLLTTLAFFNMLMYEVIKMSLGYKICWDEVWTINIITRITLMSFWTIASMPPRTNAQSEVGNIGNPDGIPSLFTILFIWVIASLMHKFIGFMTDLAAEISGGVKASALGSGLKAAANNLQKLGNKQMGEMWSKTGGKAIDRMDDVLFDSGKDADKRRAEKKAQNLKDSKNKSAMSSAGDKAISEYKKKNGGEISKMSKEELTKKLSAVRDDAMNKKGKELGLDDATVARLKSDKGFKYEGNNVFGAGLSYAKQSMGGSKTLKQSLSEKDVNTQFSRKESKKAMKNMTAEERKKFMEAADRGDVKIEKTNTEKVSSAGKKFAKYAKENPKTAAARITAGIVTLGASEAAQEAFKEYIHDAEYDKATKRLEDRGEIDRMRFGTNLTRPDEEKKLIAEELKRSQKEQKPDVKKKNTVKAIRALEKANQTQEDLQHPEETDRVREEDSIAAKVFGREKGYAARHPIKAPIRGLAAVATLGASELAIAGGKAAIRAFKEEEKFDQEDLDQQLSLATDDLESTESTIKDKSAEPESKERNIAIHKLTAHKENTQIKIKKLEELGAKKKTKEEEKKEEDDLGESLRNLFEEDDDKK